MISDFHEDATEPAPPSRRQRRVRFGHDARERRRVIITWGLLISLCVLLVNAVVGENGYLATLRAERQQTALEAQVARLRMHNQDLQRESRRLVEDPSALEETARRQLGFIRPGETLLIVRDAKPAASAPASR